MRLNNVALLAPLRSVRFSSVHGAYCLKTGPTGYVDSHRVRYIRRSSWSGVQQLMPRFPHTSMHYTVFYCLKDRASSYRSLWITYRASLVLVWYVSCRSRPSFSTSVQYRYAINPADRTLAACSCISPTHTQSDQLLYSHGALLQWVRLHTCNQICTRMGPCCSVLVCTNARASRSKLVVPGPVSVAYGCYTKGRETRSAVGIIWGPRCRVLDYIKGMVRRSPCVYYSKQGTKVNVALACSCAADTFIAANCAVVACFHAPLPGPV